MQKIVATIAMALVLFGAKTAWRMVTAEPEEEYDAAAEAAAYEEELAASFADATTSAPARGWLAQHGNMLFEGDPDQVNGLIESLHAAGATDVRFVYIEKLGGTNVSASIAARMPSDPSARARILRAEADFWEGEPEPDQGQRFVEFSFD
jgi:hypothetical protein